MCLAKKNTLEIFLRKKKRKILRFKEIGGVHLKQMSKFLKLYISTYQIKII